MKLRRLPLFYCFSVLMITACSETEHTENITAEITAAQMEGRNAAKRIVTQEWKDSSKLQLELLDARARQSKYVINGKKECAEAFDSTFIRTIRAVRPELAKSIEKKTD